MTATAAPPNPAQTARLQSLEDSLKQDDFGHFPRHRRSLRGPARRRRIEEWHSTNPPRRRRRLRQPTPVRRPGQPQQSSPASPTSGGPAALNRSEKTAALLGSPAGTLFRDPMASGGQGPKLAVIPAGRFLMGSPEDEPGAGKLEKRQ